MCKEVNKKMWCSMTPLRQFKGVPSEVVHKVEGKQFSGLLLRYHLPEIGGLPGIPNAGRLIYRLVHNFPKLQLQAQVQPITQTLLRINLSII